MDASDSRLLHLETDQTALKWHQHLYILFRSGGLSKLTIVNIVFWKGKSTNVRSFSLFFELDQKCLKVLFFLKIESSENYKVSLLFGK